MNGLKPLLVDFLNLYIFNVTNKNINNNLTKLCSEKENKVNRSERNQFVRN